MYDRGIRRVTFVVLFKVSNMSLSAVVSRLDYKTNLGALIIVNWMILVLVLEFL